MKSLLTLLTIIMLALAGCGDDCTSSSDAGVDAGGADAAIDAGGDAGAGGVDASDVGGDSQ